jgi:cytochrome oxidase Cu insertion factor (SCO1/SenC/PrrC family)
MTARTLARWLVVAVIGTACGLISAAYLFPRPTAKPVESTGNPVGDFALTERSGKTVTPADLRGKVWVASFVFTRCTGPCPQVTATVARLQSEMADLPDVRFVTFTVDPARDNPAELAEYAKHFRADPERWLFLTGEEQSIHSLMHDVFKLPIARNTSGKVEPGQEFDHSTRLVLVDRRGDIRGYFDGFRATQDAEGDQAFEANLSRLRARVDELLKE